MLRYRYNTRNTKLTHNLKTTFKYRKNCEWMLRLLFSEMSQRPPHHSDPMTWPGCKLGAEWKSLLPCCKVLTCTRWHQHQGKQFMWLPYLIWKGGRDEMWIANAGAFQMRVETQCWARKSLLVLFKWPPSILLQKNNIVFDYCFHRVHFSFYIHISSNWQKHII